MNKKELKIIKKKYPITSVRFGTIYLGVGCSHGKIYIHSNNNLELIFKISQDCIIKINENQGREFASTATSVILSNKRKKSNDKDETNENNENQFFDVRNSEYIKKQKGKYNVTFVINNNMR